MFAKFNQNGLNKKSDKILNNEVIARISLGLPFGYWFDKIFSIGFFLNFKKLNF